MYRHLLVPIDHTDLSTVTIGNAVEFARALCARITFFHAQPDPAASLSGEADVLRPAGNDEYLHNFGGRTRELLVKAESAARAHGVPCNAVATASDTPYAAIIAAARAEGCDLIYMASHGRRTAIGMMVGSQTLRVLINSEIPVFVAATAEPPAPAQAISTIRDEHRSLAAVLHAWQALLAGCDVDGTQPDQSLMEAMLHYISAFPLKLHHPKEEQTLFARLRERTSLMNAELDELAHQHRRDEQLVSELGRLVADHGRGAASPQAIANALAVYTKFIWEHMGREEGVILPAAQRYLTDEDWTEINNAFSENRDPHFAGETEAEFRRLFSRIVKLAPAKP